MATQQNTINSSPSFATASSAFNLVTKKQDKKQKHELAHLVAVLKVVEEEVQNAKSGASGTEGVMEAAQSPEGAKGPSGPSNSAFENAMADMTMSIQLLQVEIAKYAHDKSKMNSGISQALVKAAKSNLTKIEKQIAKIKSENQSAETAHFWETFAEILLAAVMTVVAVVTVQPELMIGVVLTIAAATGALGELSKGIGSLIAEIPGVSKNVADIIASVLVVIITVAATFGAGAAAGVSSVADTATEIAEDTVEAVDDTVNATEEVSTLSEISSTLQKGFKALNVFNRLSARTNLMIMSILQSVSQTNLTGNILDTTKMSDKDKTIIEGTVSAVSALVSIGAGLSMSSSAVGSEFEELSSEGKMAKIMTKLREFSGTEGFQKVIISGLVLGGLNQAAAGIYGGSIGVVHGLTEVAFGELNGDRSLLQMSMEMSSNEMEDSQRATSETEKQFSISDRNLKGLMKGEEAFGNLFTEGSPV